MRKYSFILLLLAALLATQTTQAQINMPAPSPSAMFKQTVGMTDVTVEYSRPGAKGRTIFAADGLVPYGEIWRTGANTATKITFAGDVKLGGKEVKAGSYAVLTTPMEKEWKVMLYSYEGSGWNGYVEKTPAATVTAPTKKMADMAESFTIGINNLTSNSGTLDMSWANTMVSIPMEMDVDGQVMADIERVMAGPSSNDYFNAGTYYHESGKDLNKALEYVQKATKVDEPRYWQVRREALILADMGKTKEAIAAATLSMELAKKADNQDYVRMNEKSIKEWSMKK